MSGVWLFHPNLPGQDIKVDRSALGNYARSGWQEREDQTDPVDPDTISDPVAEQDDADVADTASTSDGFVIEKSSDDEPASDLPATSTTTKKGR